MYEELVCALKKCGYPGDVHFCRDCVFTNDGGTCHREKLLPAAADAIEELSKPKWISVTEELPKVGKKVLVLTYQNDVLTARLKKQTENGFPVFECSGIFLEMAKPGRITTGCHWRQSRQRRNEHEVSYLLSRLCTC